MQRDEDDFWGGFLDGIYYGTCTVLIALILSGGFMIIKTLLHF